MKIYNSIARTLSLSSSSIPFALEEMDNGGVRALVMASGSAEMPFGACLTGCVDVISYIELA